MSLLFPMYDMGACDANSNGLQAACVTQCKVGQSKLKIKVDQYVGVAGSTVARISTRWFSGSTYCRTRLKCNEENQERIREITEHLLQIRCPV